MKQAETLHLVLKSKWYDMIDSGIKTEEYRQIKPYWVIRLLDSDYDQPIAFDFERDEGCCWGKHDYVCFHKGYTRKIMTFKIINILVGHGKPEWGAPCNKKVFIIKLGSRIA